MTAQSSSFVRQVGLTTGTNGLLALLAVLTGSLAARLLEPSGRGELAAIQMWPALLASVANLGLPQALTFHAARSPDAAGRYMGSAVCVAALASVPFFILGYFILPSVLSAQPGEVLDGARWYLLLLPIQAVLAMPYHFLRGRGDFVGWNLLRIAPGLGWLVILVVASLGGIARPEILAGAYLAVLALLIMPTFWLAMRRTTGPYWPRLKDGPPLLRFGMPSVLSGVPQLLNLRLDQLLMAAFLPPQTLGLYVVAVTWSNAVGQLPNALATVLFPRTAAQPDDAQRRAVFAHGSRLAVLASLSIAAAVALATPWMLPLLFGSAFVASTTTALILVAAAALASANHVLEEGLRGLGHPAVPLWAELAGLGVTAVALLLLLGPLQLVGAAIASVLGYGTVTSVLAFFSTRVAHCSAATLFVPTRADLVPLRRRAVLRSSKPDPVLCP